jgi:hypothetical protein
MPSSLGFLIGGPVSEQKARLRELRVLALMLLGPDHPVTRALAAASVNIDRAYPQLRVSGSPDLERVAGGPRSEPNVLGNATAHDRINRKLGDLSHMRASCLWHVLGLRKSLEDWVRVLRWNSRIAPTNPRAVLIETLRALSS